ncbi:hypothetical protein NKR23_g6400 [Pleurostoma richardsiae]|uniref:Cyclase n=1 Tax=Pleurostoma richardsiae TaxID=41990 RepID=A0AA38RL65_9PEZI|nr:hypothetical protein NKR23_g6400 [Pleurostoma richardsiae]
MEHALGLFPAGLPTLEELKVHNKDSDVPPETAWIWGKDDEIGRINMLTPDTVLAAKQEARDGDVVSLNWPMNLPAKPAFGRDACKHKVSNHPDGPMVFDDWIDMNIQSGSQWDGFRHYGHQAQGRFYNNLTPEEVRSGRGVLLDYYSWKVRKGEAYDPFTSHAIHLDELLAVAREQNVEFRAGDVLLIRSGYTSAYYEYEKSDPQRLDEAGSLKPALAGVAQTEEMKTWLHDSYFSAVAGDAPSWECWPPPGWALHEFLLGSWGVLIGEMFDLEALAKQCEKKKRWTFLFVSTPFNLPGGIASLANAVAIH